jgi:hypothetical protein
MMVSWPLQNGGAVTITPEVHTYEDEFPKHLGPPPVANHTGRKIHNATKPTYTVELDSGAFMALWEHMESEARYRFPTRDTMAYARAYLRAVEALRKAYWAAHEAPAPPETSRPRRRLARTGNRV